jgi:Undecaprenyl-phosphate galactose phosphotransferase WbaP
MFVTQLPVEGPTRTTSTAQSVRTSSPRGGLRLTALLAAADFAALAVCLLIAQIGVGDVSFSDTEGHRFLATFVFAAAGVLCFLAIRQHYVSRLPLWTEIQHLTLISGLAILFSCSVALLAQRSAVLLVLSVWLPFPVLALALRAVLRRELGARGLWQIPTVLIGRADAAQEVVTALTSESSLGYTVVAAVAADAPVLQRPGQTWRHVLDSYGAALVILIGDPCIELGRARVESLVRERIPFAVMPQPAGLPVAGFAPTSFISHDTVLISYRNNLAQPMSRGIKVAFDLFAAAIGLLVAAPVFLVVAALVKLDGGPVFFSHTRIGAGGRAFGCLKFRSMRTDADVILERLLQSDPAANAEWAQTQKLLKDPRVTRIGRVLRATSLDELPQLFNVLRLDMSLVGPRPIVTGEVHHYGEDIAYYYETRPGLTGLWQVSGRTGTTYARRVQLDSWYVRNWSIWQDLAILVQTVPAVLKRKGAV